MSLSGLGEALADLHGEIAELEDAATHARAADRAELFERLTELQIEAETLTAAIAASNPTEDERIAA